MAGILLGGFYAAVSLGISIAFGLLDVVNIAHPVFVVLGSYAVYVTNEAFGLDPIVAGIVFTPLFYLIGVVVYRVYYVSFEKKGQESLRGLVFFFGLLFIIEVGLTLKYGVDYRLVEARYIGESLHIGPVSVALRLLVPCVVAVLLTLGIYLYFSKTFLGRAIKAVAQDSQALRLMGADPVKIKDVAFGIAIAVLGGMGSIGGTLVAGLILGVIESLTSTFYGPSWSVAVSFGVLLLALAVRPAGLFGR